jgi:hypothetical protein
MKKLPKKIVFNKLKTIDPTSRTWMRLADELRARHSPVIHECIKCSYPVVSGYTCTWCFETNQIETTSD